MRILDKNTDFYDYLQSMYPDDTFTFDRTDSFVLSKEIMCEHLDVRRFYSKIAKKYDRKQYNFLLLQICHTFWLFLVEITKMTDYERPLDYTVELLATWKNYDKKRVLMTLDVISFGWGVDNQLAGDLGFWRTGYDASKITEKVDVLMRVVDINDYKVQNSINRHFVYYGDNKRVEKHLPLLKASGLAPCMNALDVFLAFEEYFSLEKSSSERTDALGTTDVDKVESHGFDAKTSFRGKQQRG